MHHINRDVPFTLWVEQFDIVQRQAGPMRYLSAFELEGNRELEHFDYNGQLWYGASLQSLCSDEVQLKWHSDTCSNWSYNLVEMSTALPRTTRIITNDRALFEVHHGPITFHPIQKLLKPLKSRHRSLPVFSKSGWFGVMRPGGWFRPATLIAFHRLDDKPLSGEMDVYLRNWRQDHLGSVSVKSLF